MTARLAFYLDADLSPKIAEIARGLGLDAVSAHEVGMVEAEDAEQLARAASETRVLLTRNRDDFLQLTLEAYHDRGPHAGLLIVEAVSGAHRHARVAHALARWARGRERVEPYSVDWLRP